MLLQASDSTFLIVDMQGRLMPVIHDNEAVLHTTHKLAQAARLLDVPVIATEHHSKMLGVTVDPLRGIVQSTFQKMHFSSTREPGFEAWLPAARKTILVAGCEAHICVLQTVIGLADMGYHAVLVSDAALAQAVGPPRRAAPRAGTWRGYRHVGNGDIRMDANLRTSPFSRGVTSRQIADAPCNIVPGARNYSLAV